MVALSFSVTIKKGASVSPLMIPEQILGERQKHSLCVLQETVRDTGAVLGIRILLQLVA